MVRWLERNGYDVSYVSGIDVARSPAEIRRHKVFLSVGHDEYWSAEQRANVEAAAAAGIHLGFFSGNEVYWKTRWDAAFRTITCYKQTAYDAVDDPSGIFTGTWRDARFRTAGDPPKPENALTGTIFGVNGYFSARILVPEADGRMRFWRGTAAASPGACGVTALAPDTLGYEFDEDADNGSRPPGLFRLSTTSASHAALLYGPGTYAAGSSFNYESGLATHHLTLHRRSSGALVFGSGTVQWPYGLDQNHLNGTNDATMQQATVNLLADMGLQPGSLQAGLALASASTDVTPPTSTITSPAAGSSVRYGTVVTITGTASDAAGRVGGVEVSIDGGATWHRAEGRESFRYRWLASASGAINLKSRAVDDSGNLETPGGITVNVGCLGPCTLWSVSAAPATPWVGDPDGVELGVRFRADADGQITGVRFYKGTGNTGPHTAHLWTASGTLLASASFVAETASGWQTATFSTPVAVSANTTYVASYHSQTGYARDLGYFAASGLYAQPLRALQSGGVYRYSTSPIFPDLVFQSTNYWVDVQLTPGQSYPRNLFGTAVPANTLHADLTGVEVGVRFRSESDGLVTAIRFYKGIGNSGTHVVNLWAPTPAATSPPFGGGGRLLGSGTSLAETASGWQTVNLQTPIQITAGTEYVASYYTSTGYARDLGYFASNTVYDPPLRALNSVYRYGRSAFPTASYSDTNYWVDPVVIPTASVPFSVWADDPTPGTPHNADPGAVEVGVQLRSEIDGYITGIRFYKHPGNTGVHTGSLWTAGGTVLATGTFTGETACGWQLLQLANPVRISASTTYVASYHTTGGYAQDVGYFSLQSSADPWKGVWNPPLRALASGEGGGPALNGVYRYGAHAFPDQTFSGANYWVDVVFKTTLR
jgi:hypothetical protein